MSKRRFALLALVVAFVLAISGSAFAASTAWRGGDGNFSEGGNWVTGKAPTSVDIAVFPYSTGTVTVASGVDVAGIRIDSGADNAIIQLTDTGILNISADLKIEPSIVVKGNATFSGTGIVNFMGEAPAQIQVDEGMALDIAVITSSDANTASLTKTGAGTLAFTGAKDNTFNEDLASVIVEDGVLSISRPGHINADANVVYLNAPNADANPVLRTTWTNTAGWEAVGKLVLSSDATLDVASGTFRVRTGKPVINIHEDGTLTKTGEGVLLLATASVVSNDTVGDIPTLAIAEGTATISENQALLATSVDVAVASGATLTLANKTLQDVGAFSGEGTLQLGQEAEFAITEDSEFEGLITGYGNVIIGDRARTKKPEVALSGITNNYTGSTTVRQGAKLIVNHANNIGGGNGVLFMEPTPTATGADNFPNFDNAAAPAYAVLEVAEDFDGIWPNMITITSFDLTGATRVEDNVDKSYGAVVIDVPVERRFEISNNIRFNNNTITKTGQGEIVFSTAGYGSSGGAKFVTNNSTDITTALHIVNGTAEIRSAYALDQGDIVVDAGGHSAGWATLRILNGLALDNSVFFTNGSTFETTLGAGNMGGGTTAATPAVTVREIFYNSRYNGSRAESADDNIGQVFHRIAFDQLGGTVTKGQNFFLLKSSRIDPAYAPGIIMPVGDDGQLKALFDTAVSNYDVIFTATSNIDIPALGTPTALATVLNTPVNFTIPVTSTTGVLAATVTGLGDTAQATPLADGNTVRITAPARATSGDVTYRLTVSTKGNTTDTEGYSNYADFTMAFNETGTAPVDPDPGTPDPVATLVGTAMSSDVTTTTAGGTVTFTLNDWTFTSTAGVKTPYAWNAAEVTYSDLTVTNATFVSATAKDDLIAKGATANVIAVKVNDNATAGSTITLTANAAVGATTGTMTGTVTVPSQGTDPEPTPDNGGGCDAGFGAFALLAVAGALVLRKKD